ncbi:GTPase/DUF3482 domain-containing protein [Desulfococcus sp.]|uniref:GTPase/DUF3482 domain-containing protein n=1 Tax=Desulfococcus sp. TaxID=2025834 RepID=UPI003594462F
MKPSPVPEFAIVGHPNEGKSSVVSTLAEDDSVRISPTPGETIQCQTFPVTIDGREVIRFIDTPGFQNPKQTLQWMRGYAGPDTHMVAVFRQVHADRPDFRDDVELFLPVERGAGIIYVVDGSRPLRGVDRAEMEILRLTGRPRMAIINCKENETGYIDQWKSEFRKHFNAIRVFNAHKATYAERISLLENLKNIDQDWQPALETVISAFKKDWEYRNSRTAEILCALLEKCLTHAISRNFTENADEGAARKALQEKYNQDIADMEQEAHRKIRRLFKHNIFSVDLPPQSILHEELFNERTWQLLGLTPTQLITAAGLGGAAVGALVDLAAHGLTFGIFSAIGGLAGAGWAALGGAEQLAKTKVVGMNLGGLQIQVGPLGNIQFFYILLDRALIYYSHVINWAHGRRGLPASRESHAKAVTKAGFATEWDDSAKRICTGFFKAVKGGEDPRHDARRQAMKAFIMNILNGISRSERPYGLVFGNDRK